MNKLSDYEQMLVKICRERAKTERMEANAVYMSGSPYSEGEERDYWHQWHNKQAEAHDSLADDMEDKP